MNPTNTPNPPKPPKTSTGRDGQVKVRCGHCIKNATLCYKNNEAIFIKCGGCGHIKEIPILDITGSSSELTVT